MQTYSHQQQQVADLAAKLLAGDVYNVEMLLEYTEEHLVRMGLQRPFVHILQCKAKEMAGHVHTGPQSAPGAHIGAKGDV